MSAPDSSQSSSSVEKQEAFELAQLPDEISHRAREVWLAGLGALSRLEEEGDKVFQDLIERGKDYESTRRKQFEDASDDLRKRREALAKDVTKRLDDATKSVEKVVSDTLSGTLGSIGVPTREEVRGLSRKVGKLSQKLDALSQMLETGEIAADEAVYHIVPHEEGWALMREGADRPITVFGTKKEAVSAGRDEAKGNVPSQLIVHKQDRSVQEAFSYDEDDAA
jgi:poly(hydroxyalkanoate) granule-associated protein